MYPHKSRKYIIFMPFFQSHAISNDMLFDIMCNTTYYVLKTISVAAYFSWVFLNTNLFFLVILKGTETETAHQVSLTFVVNIL